MIAHATSIALPVVASQLNGMKALHWVLFPSAVKLSRRVTWETEVDGAFVPEQKSIPC